MAESLLQLGGAPPVESLIGKVCSKCNITKTLADFHKDRTQPDGHEYKCKECKSAIDKQRRKDRHELTKMYHDRWYKKNREKILKELKEKRANTPNHFRARDVKLLYGITLEQVEEIFNNQGRRCAGCGSYEPRGKSKWHIDHSHETGKVRGVLCFHCNSALGLAHDNTQTLQNLIDYLIRNQ